MRRLSAAFVSASLVFLALLLSFTMPTMLNVSNGTLGFAGTLANGLDFWAWCLVVIFIAIFACAYPLEERLLKGKSTLLAALAQSGLFWALAGVGTLYCYLNAQVFHIDDRMLSIVVAYGLVVGAIVAFISRLIYPLFFRLEKTTYGLAIALVISGLLGPAIPTLTQNAPVGVGIFPELAKGELARGTWNLNPKTGVSSTEFYNPDVRIDPTKKYELSFACIPSRKPLAYTALIRNDKNHKQFAKHDFKCFGPKTIHFAVDFGGRNFDPQVMLYPTDSLTSGKALDAWAILAPVGAVK